MIELKFNDKEVNITLKYINPIGSKPEIIISGKADLAHHLIEGIFTIVDHLAQLEDCCHRSNEFKTVRDSKIKERITSL